MADNVPKKGLGVEDDNAKHQHMTTFALALGVSGTLNFRSDYRSLSTVVGDFAAIRAGTKDWPVWPDPLLTYASPGDYNNPKSIDDYWHTAVNGRGKFFNANDATSAAQGPARRVGVDRQPAGIGIGRRNLDAAAERYRQLHLLDQVPVVDLARRRRGAADRPELGRRRGQGLVGERSARPAHVQGLRQPQDLRHARRQSARPVHLADRHLSGRRAYRDAGHRPQRRRDGVRRCRQRHPAEPVPVHDRRHRNPADQVAAAGGKGTRRAGELPARPARHRRIRGRHAHRPVPHP